MTGTIEQINKTASGYEVVVKLDNGKGKIFSFGDEAKSAEIMATIRAFLLEKKEQEGRLPQLRKALLGEVVTV